ncbi:MAG: GGDEF domain-containing protein [Vallitaleaceae bacterium]|jgi:diguanylate cyclase (GGDEF)-like protein|nr:GGDEF domain-containing protein [Vallitaleaceae bacterium]
MLYNKKYIRGMSMGLLLIVISNAVFTYFSLVQVKNASLTIDDALRNSILFSTASILASILLVGLFIINNVKNDRFLSKKAEKEPETFLLNESALNHKVNEVIELSNNYGIIHAILMLDITYRGNNKTLYEIVSNLELIIRKNDVLFRMDNGFFVIIANCGIDDAVSLGDKIIKRMTALKGELQAEIAVSIGVTPTKANDSRSNLLSRANKSVLAALKYGKNRVEYMN